MLRNKCKCTCVLLTFPPGTLCIVSVDTLEMVLKEPALTRIEGGTEENMRNHSQDRCPARDSNGAPPEYGSGTSLSDFLLSDDIVV
jgi:hypothetical protein